MRNQWESLPDPIRRLVVIIKLRYRFAALRSRTGTAAPLGQLPHSEVVEAHQVRLEVESHHSVMSIHRLVVREVADHEDRAIHRDLAQLDHLVVDRLNEMAFSRPGEASNKDVAALHDKLAGSPVVHLCPLDSRVEASVEEAW